MTSAIVDITQEGNDNVDITRGCSANVDLTRGCSANVDLTRGCSANVDLTRGCSANVDLTHAGNSKVDEIRVGSGKIAPEGTLWQFNFNNYAAKKTIAKGLLDIGLLMANASQLKSLISLGPKTDYYTANMVLISLSITLQILVGIALLIIGRMEGKSEQEKRSATKLNDTIVGLVFAITVINIFVAAFGIKLSEN